MAYTLDDFARDCRAALKDGGTPGALETVKGFVAKALGDADFVATHLGPDAISPRNILYEDPELGFCIIAHVYEGAKTSGPHDHGPTWAIYGQAEGVTEMTDWKKLSPPSDDTPGRVAPVRTYTLEPGQARVYQVGDIHSPKREAATRLIRIEGRNTDDFERDTYVEAEESAA